MAGRTRRMNTRRQALLGAGVLSLALPVPIARAFGAGKPAGASAASGKKEEDIGPGEDLMREHGVLRRVLLVYGDIARRLETTAEVDAGLIQRSAFLIRRFVEDYHERQEEEMVFPRFERAHKLVELVSVLRAQHQAGRKVTDRVRGLATAPSLKDRERRLLLRDEL